MSAEERTGSETPMKPIKNVVFVDFRKGRKSTLRGAGVGSKFAMGLFLVLLALELLGAAVLIPSAIGSAFFGPTAIAIAVVGALGARRAVSRLELARTRRRFAKQRTDGRDDGQPRHTLH